MHKGKPYKCSICGAEVPDLPMLVLKHQLSRLGRRPWARERGELDQPARTSDETERMMPMEHDQAQMRQLSADRRTVRMQLPGLPIESLPKPLTLKIAFDAGTRTR